jgi:hypothetical protein
MELITKCQSKRRTKEIKKTLKTKREMKFITKYQLKRTREIKKTLRGRREIQKSLYPF